MEHGPLDWVGSVVLVQHKFGMAALPVGSNTSSKSFTIRMDLTDRGKDYLSA